MNRKLENAVRKAIREKEVGNLRKMEVEAYVIGAHGEPYSDEDVDGGCDAKVPLAELVVTPGDRIDCYVYGFNPSWEAVELVTNIEVEFGPNMDIARVRNINEVSREEWPEEVSDEG
jgi:hypothetical protein